MVKTITIKDEVYNKLMAIKGDESFSELFERLLEDKSIELLLKIREEVNLTESEKKKILEEIYKKRSERR
ncbi:MAG: antitoxin VapB family protein [Candidatus Helarchaeota archaeon]